MHVNWIFDACSTVVRGTFSVVQSRSAFLTVEHALVSIEELLARVFL
jgi:hypothetical protein